MSNRQYRLLLGTLLLIALYIEQPTIIYVLIAVSLFEGLTNFRITKIISCLRHKNEGNPQEGALGLDFKVRTKFEAEQGMRLMTATMLSISIFAFPQTTWFIPWFMGLAILGAGVSGVCPLYLVMRWAGLK